MAVPNVHGDGDAGRAVRRRRRTSRVAERGGPEHDPAAPASKTASTAAWSGSHRPPRRSPRRTADDRCEGRELARLPLPAPRRGRRCGAIARPRRRNDAAPRRVVVEHRLAIEVTLLEAHDAPASQVDRRDHLEHPCRPHRPRVSVLTRYYVSMLQRRAAARRRARGDMADDWRSADTDALLDAVVRLEDREEAARFLRDLCTLNELRDMAQRWAVVRLLDDGMHYAQISRETGASTATITRIASWLNHGEGGYREALDRLAAPARPASPTPSGATDEGPAPPRDPEQGPARRADARPAPRRGPGLRRARSQPRLAGPELRPRRAVRADERRHRVRRRRRRRPRRHRRRPARRDRRRAAATLARSATASAASLPPFRPTRRTSRSRTWPASASRPPTPTPPAGSSPSAGSPPT